MPSLVARLREAVLSWSFGSDVPVAVQQAFAAHCEGRLDRQCKLFQAVVLACNLVWWPFDWIVFSAFPWQIGYLATCRLILAAGSLLYLGLPRRYVPKRWLFWIFTAVGCVQAWAAGDCSGTIGGPGSPYVHTLYITIFATVPLPIQLGRRALVTALLAASIGVGHVMLHPQHLGSPEILLVVSFLTLSVFLSTWFGHMQFRLGRQNFLQAHELGEHTRLLESRVAERTEDLRDLLDHVETAREEERARISRDLHDELGQELSALRYSLGYTLVRYGREPDAISANLEDLDALLRRTTHTTRNIVTALRPRVLDDLGLGAAVEWLLGRTEQRSELVCRLTMADELTNLDGRVGTTAFRVLQEALTNVVRHAGAKAIDVELTATDAHVELRVADDGIGIDAGRAQKGEESSGVGLLGMRERVHALGGSLSIVDRHPQRGTEVRCKIPRNPMSIRGAARSTRSPARWARSVGGLS